MRLLLNTASADCQLLLVDQQGVSNDFGWPAGRDLARDLLPHIESALQTKNCSFSDLTGLAAFRGPGSFTGLRIGCTVLNTLANELNLAIVGVEGDGWQRRAIERLQLGENDQIVMPHYDRPANITQPKK